MAKQRLYYIDFLETIAILLVIYCHFLSVEGTTVISNVLMQFATTVAVPIFFMANGTLLFLGKFDLNKHLKKTFWLFITSVSWKVAYLAVIFAKSHFYLPTLTWSKVFLYFCGTNIEDPFIPSAHFWFLYALIGMYLIFPILKICYDSEKKSVFLYLTILLFFFVFFAADWNALALWFSQKFGISQYTMTTLGNAIFPFSFSSAGSYLLFFIAGPFLHNTFYETGKALNTRLLLLGGASISFCLLLIQKYFQNGSLTGEWTRLADDYQRTGTLLMAACLYALFSTIPFSHPRHNEVWRFISLRTMNVYAIHMMLIFLWESYIYPCIPFNNVLIHIASSLIVLVLAILITEPVTWLPGLRMLFGLKPFHGKRKEWFNHKRGDPVA